MHKFLLFLSIFTIAYCLTPNALFAQNNKVGVHILEPSEIHTASKIVNGNGGDWGYVTIPIRVTDRDLKKWQTFMTDAANLHLIPIIRIAGVPDGPTWRRPSFDEVLDFSNFLNDLDWPTRQKHVVIFNEPNHAQEWGGKVDPASYASILEFAAQRFKSLDPDFVILPAGLDASVPDSVTSTSLYKFLKQMASSNPEVFDQIDGWTSHSYPNPEFSGSPSDRHPRSINSFTYELRYLKRFTQKPLPVFITETGWQMHSIPEETVAKFYETAFTNIWSNVNIIAVTPFVLRADQGDFVKFSLLNSDNSYKLPASSISSLPKVKGDPQIPEPKITPKVIIASSHQTQPSKVTVGLSSIIRSIKSFFAEIGSFFSKTKPPFVKINDIKVSVEIAQTDSQRAKGLSGHAPLAEKEGMIFLFEKPGRYSFWMKDMLFPLDFIWIKSNRVVDLNSDIPNPKESESPAVVSPSAEVDSVLEVNAGFIDKFKIKVGDIVNLDRG